MVCWSSRAALVFVLIQKFTAYDLFIINVSISPLRFTAAFFYTEPAPARGNHAPMASLRWASSADEPRGLHESRGQHWQRHWPIRVRYAPRFLNYLYFSTWLGYAADALGRKAVCTFPILLSVELPPTDVILTRLDGKELMLIIVATILTITTPTGSLSPEGSLIYLAVFRILLGVGVGGDYPMSASVASDRANLRKRGTMLAYIFSNQGWGSLVGSLVTLIVLACYKPVMESGKTSKVDGGKNLPSAILLLLLIKLFLDPSLANCCRPFSHSCMCHTVSTPHVTRIHPFFKSSRAAQGIQSRNG